MQALLPTLSETAQINRERADIADAMAHAGEPGADMLAIVGPCSADRNRIANGELGTVVHLNRLSRAAQGLGGILLVGRYVGIKPRTNIGPTGLLHQVGGHVVYAEGARALHRADVPLASETMSDTDAAFALPHMALAWSGARNVEDTGPRYLVRPTTEELEAGIHPVPVLAKAGRDGSLDGVVHAISTITSEKPEPRTRMTLTGPKHVMTHANPHVGVILRGSTVRPEGPLPEVLAAEITTAREVLAKEFGGLAIPVIVDISHDHAKWEGGGEEGQLAIMQGLMDASEMGVKPDGIMAETYIQAGKQPGDGTEPGLSTTDPCIGQENAEQLLIDISKLSRSEVVPA